MSTNAAVLTAILLSVTSFVTCVILLPWVSCRMQQIRTDLRQGMRKFTAVSEQAWAEVQLAKATLPVGARSARQSDRCSEF